MALEIKIPRGTHFYTVREAADIFLIIQNPKQGFLSATWAHVFGRLKKEESNEQTNNQNLFDQCNELFFNIW